MELKAFAATLGLGMAAGAAAVFLIPKDSRVYQAAEDAVDKLKEEAVQAMTGLTDG